jgi:HAT1-interacting factor 1
VETALEHARRAFALKKYEQAVEYYATALELQYVIEIGLMKPWF